MADLRNPTVLYAKGLLFLAIGLLAAIGLLVEHASIRTFILLALCVWGFARAYYFAFYVIEHYIDGGYRFAGLVDFARYVAARRKRITSPSARPGPAPQYPAAAVAPDAAENVP